MVHSEEGLAVLALDVELLHRGTGQRCPGEGSSYSGQVERTHMKINCGLSESEQNALVMEKAARLHAQWSDWHPHFCIIPRRVGHRDCRWLETVERRLSPQTKQSIYDFLQWGSPLHFEYRPSQGKGGGQ